MLKKKNQDGKAKKHSHLCLPHKPELKDVDVSPTLDGLVTRVVGNVVLLVLLEEVAGAHGVAALQ